MFEWLLLIMSILVLLILFGLEKLAKQKLPKNLWRLVWTEVLVIIAASLIGLLPYYIHTFQPSCIFFIVMRITCVVILIAVFVRTFFPFDNESDGVDEQDKNNTTK